MAVVFSDHWGTEEFPIDEDKRDLAAFFDFDSGAAQLRQWVLKSLMDVGDSMIDYATPPPNFLAFVRGLLITLRG